ncbi:MULTISPECIES: metal ABC transporter ATP-binding protein [Nocardiopsis]|uniref:ABC transporter related protein n=2 Tax=Nocardiopsis TaxID=2013 RepID=D7AYJ6_NOCDD|nr:ABC transporter ATP-binding protein [Nocardiopsis dassonvillei]ADH66181.1 ABC transporter related protein [Nocardiopsis dassonvillei subsp. dassonvillei DSM 43111]APC34506.1 ABC transporter ATP-binding protein [Nocardiopsis dassonvillei]NKY78230.1 ABC transporter ATP-binding protein [Nocardiopsis dassonvillei]VEI92201.1 Glutamine transport ATP-binding protein GlnQ [Nocardiopsis dassonvillei]
MSDQFKAVAGDAPPAFQAVDARVAYDGVPVLDGVSLDVPAGQTMAVLGPNGSGKSTLMRSMLGIVPLTSGEVLVHGVPLRRFRAWRRIGYVPQRLTAGGAVPATVREIVASGQVASRRRLSLPTRADRAAVDEALETVGLADRGRDAVRELSGGQQQRVLIARALAGRPDTFVMDEPMAGVDAENQRALAGTITRLRERGATVVLVLHELGPLEDVIERAVVLESGRVVHDGAAPAPTGECARPGHEHQHPHPDPNAPDSAGTTAAEMIRLEVPGRD